MVTKPTKMEQAFIEIEKARELLIASIKFDLFTDPIFIESFICKICGLEQTGKQEKYDAKHPDGFTVEIKYSALSTVKGLTIERLAFSNLRGTTKKGKEADVYILVGYAYSRLRFFVFTENALSKRTKIEIHLQDRRYRNTGKWLEYEVTLKNLKTAIEERGKQQKSLSPLFSLLKSTSTRTS